MVKPDRPAANGFVSGMRKLYNPIGFSKGYNFTLFFIFAGGMMGFCLFSAPNIDVKGTFCGPDAGGECYYYTKGIDHIGFLLHLATILPAGILVCFQFVPAIRHKAIILHRINGYIVITLSIAATVGALISARRAYGGGLEVQAGVGLVGILWLGCMLIGYINIKRLQLEQHRAWMLRAWFYGSCIITLRAIMFIMAMIIGMTDNYYSPRQCGQIDYVLGRNETLQKYPECDVYYSGENLEKSALVVGKFQMTSPESESDSMTTEAALGLAFGPALWLALAIHAIGIELYLRLTPAEHNRLRNVSYKRQLEAGMRNPGRAGLTADRLGDAPLWKPEYKPLQTEDDEQMLLKHRR